MSLFSTLVMLILLIGVLIQGGHGAETLKIERYASFITEID